MTQTLTAHRGAGDLDPTLVADDTLVTDILIFTAIALPIPGGAKNSLTEQTILLRPQPSIVDRLRLGNLTV
jgi:hypothetical protein